MKALTWLTGQYGILETYPRFVHLQCDGNADHLVVQMKSRSVELMSCHVDEWSLGSWSYCVIHQPAAQGTLHWIARANARGLRQLRHRCRVH
ncbi:hypothetical protein N9448_03065 [Litorivicinus sp.]|nr:hypothetical protein [Litorivicinus sp.]